MSRGKAADGARGLDLLDAGGEAVHLVGLAPEGHRSFVVRVVARVLHITCPITPRAARELVRDHGNERKARHARRWCYYARHAATTFNVTRSYCYTSSCRFSLACIHLRQLLPNRRSAGEDSCILSDSPIGRRHALCVGDQFMADGTVDLRRRSPDTPN